MTNNDFYLNYSFIENIKKRERDHSVNSQFTSIKLESLQYVPSSRSRSKKFIWNLKILLNLSERNWSMNLDSNQNGKSDEGSNSYFRSIGNDDLLMKEDEQM